MPGVTWPRLWKYLITTMKITVYLLPGTVGLKFETTPERTAFLAAFSAKNACEAFGMRTLRIHPEKVQAPGTQFVTELITSLGSTNGNPVKASPPERQEGHMVNIAATPNPFAITGQHVTKPLPGLVNVQSNIPQGETLPVGMGSGVAAQSAPVEPSPSPQAAPVVPEQAPTPQADDDPEPKHLHRNSRAYRNWLARHPKAK